MSLSSFSFLGRVVGEYNQYCSSTRFRGYIEERQRRIYIEEERNVTAVWCSPLNTLLLIVERSFDVLFFNPLVNHLFYVDL